MYIHVINGQTMSEVEHGRSTVKHDIFMWKKFSRVSQKRKFSILQTCFPPLGLLYQMCPKISSRENFKIEKTQNFRAVTISCFTVCQRLSLPGSYQISNLSGTPHSGNSQHFCQMTQISRCYFVNKADTCLP